MPETQWKPDVKTAQCYFLDTLVCFRLTCLVVWLVVLFVCLKLYNSLYNSG